MPIGISTHSEIQNRLVSHPVATLGKKLKEEEEEEEEKKEANNSFIFLFYIQLKRFFLKPTFRLGL